MSEHTCHDMNPPFPYPCLACAQERLQAIRERLGAAKRHDVPPYRHRLSPGWEDIEFLITEVITALTRARDAAQQAYEEAATMLSKLNDDHCALEQQLADRTRAQARLAWQPIETAPKAEYVLVWNGRAQIATFILRWQHQGRIVKAPSHWMPLPQPPAETLAAVSPIPRVTPLPQDKETKDDARVDRP